MKFDGIGFDGNKRVNIIHNRNIVKIFTQHKRNTENFFIYRLKFVNYH